MSSQPYGKYTDEDGEYRPLHNHNTAIIGGPPSRYRHPTSWSEHGLGGKPTQVATVTVIVLFNASLAWALGRWICWW